MPQYENKRTLPCREYALSSILKFIASLMMAPAHMMNNKVNSLFCLSGKKQGFVGKFAPENWSLTRLHNTRLYVIFTLIVWNCRFMRDNHFFICFNNVFLHKSQGFAIFYFNILQLKRLKKYGIKRIIITSEPILYIKNPD